MKLIFTDPAFTVHGQRYAGIPFLLDADMALVDAPNDYLYYIAVVRGRTRSPRTWQTYANHLYEFFAFLEANGFQWDQIYQTHLAAWRDSMLERRVKRTTVNQRLSAVAAFYQWAMREGRIASLPFHKDDVRVARPRGFLAHVDASGNRVAANELTLPTYDRMPRFLLTEQARVFVSMLSPRRNRLIACLMWLAGLRREEAVWLDLRVLPNPAGHPPERGLRMELDASLTPTKGDKTRWVLVPYDLAVRLWEYLTFERPRLAKLYGHRHGKETTHLFLTEHGERLSLEGMNNAFRRASVKSGIPCTPHVLRHTFGTYEFLRVSERKGTDRALHWVRDRMGHSSIIVTEKYVHAADLVEQDAADEYRADICAALRG